MASGEDTSVSADWGLDAPKSPMAKETKIGLAVIAGIDRILDMARTTVNVTGDLMVSVLIAKSEGELDEEIYNKVATV